MQATLNWLKDYVDINIEPAALAEKLTLAGIAVEHITQLGEGLEGVITGKIVKLDKHPDADKLLICSIDVNKEELLTIVTGADNVFEGAIIPVAVVGSRLPNGMKMKKAKLRGIMSEGMLCSSTELGLDAKTLLPKEREGIFILSDQTPLGIDIKKILGLDDIVFEFEITANRPDCFSIIGLAREISALTGSPLKTPNIQYEEKLGKHTSELIKISIHTPSLCARFAGKVIKDITIAPSPTWMQNRLRACGVRPISNIVDVTNYVMLETGQPLHAYDYECIAQKEIMARLATDQEDLMTLDSNHRKLHSGMLVIADAEKALGLAGVMGGLDSEVTDSTKNTFLESAAFAGVPIRRTSREIGLRSEASGRFERGVDRVNTLFALHRATHLLLALAGGAASTDIVDCNNHIKDVNREITVDAQAINKLLGTNLALMQMEKILEQLFFKVTTTGNQMAITIPSWRSDVTVTADIAEEISRTIGFANILSSLPEGKIMEGAESEFSLLTEKVRDILAASGMSEVINYSFVHPTIYDKLNLPAQDSLRQAIEISNPISEEFKILRTNLLGSILQSINYNLSKKNNDLAIFEVGHVYLPKSLPLTDFPVERIYLAGAFTGRRYDNWHQAKEDYDFFDAKGAIENIFAGLQLIDYSFKISQQVYLHPGKSADIYFADQVVGYIGEVHPKVQENFDIGKTTYAFEIDLSKIFAITTNPTQYTAITKYPVISRDLAFLVPIDTPSTEITSTIANHAGEYLAKINLFDIYQGKQIPEGYKSMAFSLLYQAPDKTLTDEEVDSSTKNILSVIKEKYNIELR